MTILLRTLLSVFIGGTLCLHEAGQITSVSADESTDTQTETPSDPAAKLEAERKAVSENTAIDDAARARIDELYGKAVLRIGETAANDARRQQLIKELESLSSDAAEVQLELDTFSPTETTNLIKTEANSEAVAQQLNDARAQATARRAKLEAITAEINRRAERRTQIPSLRIQTQQSLDAVDKELAAAVPPDELAELTAARRALLQARKRFLQSQLALFEQESQTFESTVRLSTARRDLEERHVKDADNVVTAIQDRLSEVRRTEASVAAQQARIAAANAHPAVADVATRNTALAEEIQQLLRALERTQEEIDQATELQDSLEDEFHELQKRAELAGFSQAIGVLLRLQRNRIPDSAPYAARAHERSATISDINLRLIEWESERSQIVDTDEAVELKLDTVTASMNEFEKAAIAYQLRQMLEQSKQLLSKAIEEVGRYLDRLVTLDSLERELTAIADSQSAYIAEHVLWVRSAEPAGLLTVRNAWDGIVRMLTQSFWEDAYSQLAADIIQQPVMWAAFALLFIWLLFMRGRLRTTIREDGQIAARSNCTTIRPTFRAILDSILLAALCPASVWFVGWRMTSLTATDLPHSIGSAFQSTAFMWMCLELLRQLIRTGGVFELHFGWPQASLHVVRRWLGITMFLTIPACWVLLVCEGQYDEILHAGLGRFAFAFCTLVLAIGLIQVLRGNGAVARDISLRGPKTLLAHSRPLWSAMSILAPVGLTILSLYGYQYSALQMSKRVLATNGLICLLAVVFFLMNRWLLVTYRRIAIERTRQRREALLREATAQADEEDGSPTPIEADTVPKVSLSNVNQQTRKLILVGTCVCGALGLWIIWIDVLPALGILRRVELWPNQIAAAIDTDDGSVPPRVTLADLALAIGGGILTIVAARNLPGLLEITLLQRLPLDAGTRYAASSLTRYLIAIIGVTLAFWLLGIGWSSLQWLIAAMTVGLGFGLQEIFANFVSGLILLFERPVRIGDTVTVNNITGTVSRIRIRATTILDWDNKELIVPNRAFVTDNLINWTLTNPDLRMILRVGIAYGSDTRLATELLYQVANENEKVLADPEPVVVFKEFGDSSLNFELRVFVTGLMTYRLLQHELNISIDDVFRTAGIEIAFPQRDLHVRTLPQELLQQTDGPTDSAPC